MKDGVMTEFELSDMAALIIFEQGLCLVRFRAALERIEAAGSKDECIEIASAALKDHQEALKGKQQS